MTRVDNGKATVLGKNLKTPPVNVGAKSTPNYEALSNAAIQNLSDGSKVFAGQADDPFFVDLNVFDLLTIRKLPGNMGGGVDGLKGYNVQTIALQVPMSQLTSRRRQARRRERRQRRHRRLDRPPSRQATRVLKRGGGYGSIRRLGAGQPPRRAPGQRSGRAAGRQGPVEQLQAGRRRPVPGWRDRPRAGQAVQRALYKIKVPPAPRDDLVAIFLTGIPGATMPPNLKPSEELRLNMGVPPVGQP